MSNLFELFTTLDGFFHMWCSMCQILLVGNNELEDVILILEQNLKLHIMMIFFPQIAAGIWNSPCKKLLIFQVMLCKDWNWMVKHALEARIAYTYEVLWGIYKYSHDNTLTIMNWFLKYSRVNSWWNLSFIKKEIPQLLLSFPSLVLCQGMRGCWCVYILRAQGSCN